MSLPSATLALLTSFLIIGRGSGIGEGLRVLTFRQPKSEVQRLAIGRR